MVDYIKGRASRSSKPTHPKMNPLGQSGLWCNPIGFGCYRIDKKNPKHEAALLHYFQNGGNLIDTSANYTDGRSERTIGRVLKKIKREDVIIVTKAGYIQGENLAIAKETSFPETIKYAPDLWHSIHPEFLKTQIERSCERMEIETIDIFLLHNPEYFLSYQSRNFLQKSDYDEFYRRIHQAFVFLETQVTQGRIGCYGISSNNFPLLREEETFVSLSRCLEQAQLVSKNHHFQVVQFPLNLFEPGAALYQNNRKLTLLQFCSTAGLGTLANRPLNAFVHNNLIRLADFISPGSEVPGIDKLDSLLLSLAKHEQALQKQYNIPLLNEFGISAYLKDIVTQIKSEGAWEQIANNHVIYPIHQWMSQIEKDLKNKYGFADWQDNFTKIINPLFSKISRYIAAQNQPQSDQIRERLYAAGYPIGNLTLSQMALSTLTSLPGLNCVLLGMRKPEYVDDAMLVLDLEKMDGLETIKQFYYSTREQ